MKKLLCASLLALGLAACERQAAAPPVDPSPHVVAANQIDAGRYLVVMGGCNDCHTANYGLSNGKIPEADWLLGAEGFNGPWGTSYPSNLRLLVNEVDEAAWVTMLKTRDGLPPMPWVNLHQAHESDLKAIYAYIKSLGPKGEKNSGPQPPGETPKHPYYYFMPLTGKPPKG